MILNSLRDIRVLGMLLCVAALLAGKFTLGRLLPFAGDWSPYFSQLRLYFLLGAGLAVVAARLRDRAWPLPHKATLAIVIPYAVFSVFYALFPFPLTSAPDVIFAAVNVILFAMLYESRHQNILTAMLIGFGSLLIAAAAVTTPWGERLAFAGSSATFVRIIALSSFLLVLEKPNLPRLGLLLLHGAALSFSVQISALLVPLFCLAAMPPVLLGKALTIRQSALNGLALFIGCFIGWAVMHDAIDQKVAFRAKEAEVQQLIKTQDRIKSDTFPGGLYVSEILLKGEKHSVKLPDFDRDTRICIDDRSDRLKLFATALTMQAQSPSRWGWGDNAFAMPLTRYGITDIHRHPHNIFLEVLVVRGPYFLAAFLVLVYAAGIQALAACVRQAGLAPFAMAMAYVLLTAQWSGDFFDFRWFFLLLIPAAAAAFDDKRGRVC